MTCNVQDWNEWESSRVDNFRCPGGGGRLDQQRQKAGKGSVTGTMLEKRFLTLADVGEVLNISSSQTYALVRSGELPAIQVGGRGQWRVESAKLEEYIAGAYRKAAAAREAVPVDEAADA